MSSEGMDPTKTRNPAKDLQDLWQFLIDVWNGDVDLWNGSSTTPGSLISRVDPARLYVLHDPQLNQQITDRLKALFQSRCPQPWESTEHDDVLYMASSLVPLSSLPDKPASPFFEFVEQEVSARIRWIVSIPPNDPLMLRAAGNDKTTMTFLSLHVLIFNRLQALVSARQFTTAKALYERYQVDALLMRVPKDVEVEIEIQMLRMEISYHGAILEIAMGKGDYSIAIGEAEYILSKCPLSREVADAVMAQMRENVSLLLATLYRCVGKYAKAVECARLAKLGFKNRNLPVKVFQALFSMAQSYAAARDLQRAVETQKESAEFARKHGLEFEALIAYRDLAISYLQLGNPNEAQFSLEQAKSLREKISNAIWAAHLEREFSAMSSDLKEQFDQHEISVAEFADIAKVKTAIDPRTKQDLIDARISYAAARESSWNTTATKSQLFDATIKCQAAVETYRRLFLHAEEARCHELAGSLLGQLGQKERAKDALLAAVKCWGQFRQKTESFGLTVSSTQAAANSRCRISGELTSLGYLEEAWSVLQGAKASYLTTICGLATPTAANTNTSLKSRKTEDIEKARSRFVSAVRDLMTQNISTLPDKGRESRQNTSNAPGAGDAGNSLIPPALEYLQQCKPVAIQDSRTFDHRSEVVDYKLVSKALPEDSAVLDFLRLDQRLQVFIIRHGCKSPDVVSWVIPSAIFDQIVFDIRAWSGLVQLGFQSRKIVRSKSLSNVAEAHVPQQHSDQTLKRLWIYFIEPVISHIAGAKRLFIVPHNWIHALPLHCAIDRNGKSLQEQFDVRYLPSVLLVGGTQSSGQESRKDMFHSTPQMLSVINPDQGGGSEEYNRRYTLPFALWEGSRVTECLKSAGGEVATLTGSAAQDIDKVTAWRDIDIFHFSGHADVVPGLPLANYLRLGTDILSAQDVLSRCERFKPGALAILNACGTNEVDVRRTDDALGLASVFLTKGAGAVIGTLWPVSDLASAFLISQLVQHMIVNKITVDHALGQAIKNLRQLRWDDALSICDETQRWCSQNALIIESENTKLVAEELQRARIANRSSNGPFEHPAFWTPFQLIGGWH